MSTVVAAEGGGLGDSPASTETGAMEPKVVGHGTEGDARHAEVIDLISRGIN